MTLEEAIKTLERYLPTHRWPPNTGLQDAMKLGIEALKRCKEARKKAYFTTRTPLPSETKR